MSIKPIEVSLIICGYNGESTLHTAMDSAVAQTLKELEIICVNDASPDHTLEVFRKYAAKDRRIKIIDHPVNKGLFVARQSGVNNASGKYIMFLDQDDALLPEACAELSEKMNETGCDIVQFDTELVFESEEERKNKEAYVKPYFSFDLTEPLYSSDDILKACFIEKKFPWNVWSKIYKTEISRKVYSYVPDNMKLVMAEDTLAFLLVASLAEHMEISTKKYYSYSVGVGVSGKSIRKNEESSLEVYYSLIKPLATEERSAVFHEIVDGLGRWFRQCLANNLITNLPQETYKETIERENKKFGLKETALLLVENWNFIGHHPMKTVFLGLNAEKPSNRVEKIHKISVVCSDTQFSSSLLRLIENLCSSGYKIELFAQKKALQSSGNSLKDCQIQELPEDSNKFQQYFDKIIFKSESDAFILSYSRKPVYDLTMFLITGWRLYCEKPLFVFLDGTPEVLSCHDKICLSAADCVLSSSDKAELLFGTVGKLSEKINDCNQLKGIIKLFENKQNKDYPEVLLSSRNCMKATALRALSSLNCAGFAEQSLDRTSLEQKLAACGAPLSAEDYILIRESGFFDEEYYKRQFPDIVIDDPIIHFSTAGIKQLANPSSIFSVKEYCIENPDLPFDTMNLLLHYLRYGIFERRKVISSFYDIIINSEYFDEEFYCREHGDELGSLTPAEHYLLLGWKKGYSASTKFIEKSYCDFHVEMENGNINPLYHYIYWGKDEGRCAFSLKPRYENYFPEGYDVESFWKRQSKYLIVIHQLDFTGVPILAKMIAEIFQEEKNVAILTPMDGPLRETCLKAGIPVLIDSDFYLHKEKASFYKEKGFSVCLYNTIGLAKTFLRNVEVIPSVLWIHDNVPKDYLPQRIQKEIWFAPTLFATSKTTTEMVQGYNPSVGYLPYPIKDKGTGHKENIPQKIRFGIFGV